jgi:DNA-directed RNA polymerase subunit RPC12/RpoP
MASADDKTQKLNFTAVTSRDILFECPSCGKNLVVDEAAQGLIVDCPQCRINVIVPPKPVSSAPPLRPQAASSASATGARNAKPSAEPAQAGHPELAVLQERLTALGNQLKELQTQRTEINNRFASRMNEINRDLVMIARLETSHQQILSEWNQIVSQIGAYSPQTTVVGASVRSGRSRVQFGS